MKVSTTSGSHSTGKVSLDGGPFPLTGNLRSSSDDEREANCWPNGFCWEAGFVRELDGFDCGCREGCFNVDFGGQLNAGGFGFFLSLMSETLTAELLKVDSKAFSLCA